MKSKQEERDHMVNMAQWELMENIQDAQPYYNFGWDGFVMFVWFAN